MSMKSPVCGKQTGQSLVETALFIPIIVLLFLGIVEFGFAFYAFVQVSNATREGARAGSLYRETCASEHTLNQTVAQAYRASLGLLSTTGQPNPTVSPSVGSCGVVSQGQPITVTAVYNYQMPLVSGLIPVIPSTFPMTRTVGMRFQ